MTSTPYIVRDVPRGVPIGTVYNIRLRSWEASCDSCGFVVYTDTRPGAARRLQSHVRRAHWMAP